MLHRYEFVPTGNQSRDDGIRGMLDRFSYEMSLDQSDPNSLIDLGELKASGRIPLEYAVMDTAD